MENILVDVNNNYHPFRLNIDFAQAKFLPTSKISKKSIYIFFSNLDLTSMQEQLSYKNVDKMQALFIE